MKKLENKVAVITGGNSGIGLQTAKAFLREGAKVVISGRDAEKLEAAQSELGEGAVAVQGDVTNLEDLDRLFSTTVEQFGKIDILYANAGIATPAPVELTTEELFDRTFNINVKGAFFTVQKAIPHLNEGASVILTSSTVQTQGLPGLAAYSASKAAARSLVRTLAAELSPKGIRVNAISPGPIETPIYSRMGLPQEAVQEMGAQILSKVPLARFGSPEEIANPMVFLASKDSSYMQGAELTVDGGMGGV